MRSIFYTILLFLIAAGTLGAQQTVLHEHHPVCATALWMQARSGQSKHLSAQLQSLASQISSTRPVLVNMQSMLTSGGHFRIHYTTKGADSVSVTDKDANSIPDYIDSMAFYLENAWQVEVNDYGYTAPPADNLNSGEGAEGPEVDVYVQALSKDTYGGAVPDNNVVGSGRVSGYLWLDNDYAGYPTSGLSGLKVTCAHEFHHIIQFSAYYFDYSQAGIYESTAVWFEQQVYPNIPDYRFYVNALLDAPQRYGFGTNDVSNGVVGYSHETFLEMLVKKAGNNRDLIREWWERFRSSHTMFDDLDAVLHNHGLALSSIWCEYARWCYYTGKRAGLQQDTAAALNNAGTLFNTMKEAGSHNLDAGDALFDDVLYPLSFGLYRATVMNGNVNIRDTVDFLVSNARSNLGKGGFSFGPESFTVDISSTMKSGYVQLLRTGKPTLYYRLSTSSAEFCIEAIANGSAITSIAQRTFPQPFINDGVQHLLIGVTLPNEQVRTLHVRIYSASMTLVSDFVQIDMQSINNLLGASWDGKDMHGTAVPSGTYIYTLSVNDAEPSIGKISVVTK